MKVYDEAACRSTYGQICDYGYQTPARQKQSFADMLATHPSNCNSVRLSATFKDHSQSAPLTNIKLNLKAPRVAPPAILR